MMNPITPEQESIEETNPNIRRHLREVLPGGLEEPSQDVSGPVPRASGVHEGAAPFATAPDPTPEAMDDDPRPVDNRYLPLPLSVGGEARRGVLELLARAFHLDVYGDYCLYRRSSIDLGYAAVLLVIVFIFDLGAWSLLFNAILHGDAFKLDGLTAVAMGMGLLLAITVLIYERQFITADLSGKRRYVIGATLLRVLVVGLSAVITAQPVEALLFEGPISKRAREESLRIEAVQRLKDLDKAFQKALGKSSEQIENDVSTKRNELGIKSKEQQEASTREDIRRAEEDLRSLKSSEKDLSRRRSSLIASRVTVEGQREDAARRGAQSEVAALDGKIEQLSRQINSTSAQLRDISRKIEEKNASRDSLNEELRGIQDKIASIGAAASSTREKLESDNKEEKSAGERELASLRDYLLRIQNAPPGEPVPRCLAGEKPLWAPTCGDFKDAEYDLFDRLQVIEDLRNGVPPRWRVGSEVDHERLKRSMEFLADGSYADRRDLYTRAWYAIYGIAVVIPLLLIAMKLLMSAELRKYYESKFQAASGNPEALAFEEAKRRTDEASKSPSASP